ncbi:putative toxin-antitoxin system toxin component, PIN family [Polynucleobacter hallstattensis]|uniref:putative toxin-antitoxin system toxin component, PIN family n=1 Tax=Polynucleobacter hallstattensis TaxID=1855586 RepID=UPI001C0C7D44|nr:putative toxin-antitoxin system toxin component, PIN family [Polynucleobacter hallstattensis]MBU3560286.1 putative toxin-antitoxin system toxin component, PIN family [Polynucleobacter hallstattensis]
MRPVVLDTNILLDIFVFNDKRALHLKEVLFDKSIRFIASQKAIEEFADVLSRPLFKLDEQTQVGLLAQWQSIAEQQDDSNLAPAPWKCKDPDDQIFLDLAYQLKPTILISKDNAVLQIASRAASENILITSDYNAFRL